MPVFRELMCFPILITIQRVMQHRPPNSGCGGYDCSGYQFAGDANITHQAGNVYLDVNASWSDAVDGSGVIVANGEVNASIPGTYVLSYNYNDSG